MDKLSNFIISVQRRLNNGVMLRTLVRGLLVMSVVSCLVSLGFIVRGYRVDTAPFRILLPGLALIFLAGYFFSRWNRNRAIHFAERFFALSDSLISVLQFACEGKTKGIYALQRAQAEEQCKRCEIRRIPVPFPFRESLIILALMLLNLWLLSFDDASHVAAVKLKREETGIKTDLVNEQLERKLDKIEDRLSKEEREILEKSGIRKRIRELRKTDDRKEALRQLAQLEQEIRNIMQNMQLRENEAFLAKLAEEMKKRDATRKLGQQLAEKNYKTAADLLAEMKKQKGSKPSRDELERMRKMAERMREAAERMAENRGKLREYAGKIGETGREMEQKLRELSDITQDTEQNNAAQMQKLADNMQGDMQQFGRELGKHAARREFMAQMQSMMQGIMQAESFVRSSSQTKGQKGMGIGMGSDSGKKSDDYEKLPTFMTEIKGQHGVGPSAVSIEEAAFGTGVSRIEAGSANREFKHQVESYIRREDVPVPLRQGVKNYFEIIHTPADEPK